MIDKEIDKLKSENTKLKEEQKYLYNQLKKLNIKLEESDAFKSHFLSNISNEIINPFTSILGISQNILSLGDCDIEQIHGMANLIYSEAFDLDFQLRNIFAAAKIESGDNQLELSDINVELFINDIIENLRLKAEKHTLYFEFTHFLTKENFTTDINKLSIIIINLIMNAITFSEKRNKITIHVELNDKGFLFKVNNQGNTISSENADLIFDRFKKLDDSINSLNQGHGLGLSIIKDYLELLGGTINLESNEEGGTTFSMSLPPIENKVQGLFMEDENLFSSDDTELF